MITGHKIYLFSLVSIVLAAFAYLSYFGFSYYQTPIAERFFHPSYRHLKPGGLWGHGLGIIGTMLIVIGVSSYMMRKRMNFMSRWGRVKHWLEFHIFLCTLGPLMVLFHTSFKFGGLVAISFWSMVAVFLSGIFGRFIYLQIPRTIEGRELSLSEVRELKTNLTDLLNKDFSLDDYTRQMIDTTSILPESNQKINLAGIIEHALADVRIVRELKIRLRQQKFSRESIRTIVKLTRNELSLNRRIARLQVMHSLFRYWHVFHLPFALIMLIIMVIHVAVTLALGYRWVF